MGTLKVHHASTDDSGQFDRADTLIDLPDEPGHQELCDREQAFVANAIQNNIDLTRHMTDAVDSLRICLAADESIRSGKPVDL